MDDLIDEDLEAKLADPLWRLGYRTGVSIYSIISKDGKGRELFRPTLEQKQVIAAIYILGWEFIIIPKSRQLGMSTVICLIIADLLIFSSGVQCSIVDKGEDDAQKKLEEKVKFAFDSLGPEFRSLFYFQADNKGEFTLRRRGAAKDDNSRCYATVTPRGGTNSLLMISEWGPIQEESPQRSKEILTGALPTADHPGCITIVETTWKGGRSGELWGLMRLAQSIPEHMKGPKDPRVMFFGWHTNPDNRDDGDPSQITQATRDYFNGVAPVLKKDITPAQMLWWQKNKEKYGIFMGSEHPTIEDECYDSPTEGAFFDAAGLRFQQDWALTLRQQWKPLELTLHGQGPNESASPHYVTEANARFTILEPPKDGCRYIIPIDFRGMKMAAGSSGERDANAACVIRDAYFDHALRRNFPPQIVCALLPNDQTETPETIQRIKAMYLYYGRCTVVPEINNKDNIAGQLMAIGVDNIWFQSVGADGAAPGRSKTKKVYGWLTNEGTRRQMLDALKAAIREQALIVGLECVADELRNFIVPPDGRPEAAAGCHDDWVLMLAIGWFCRNAATVYSSAPPVMWTPQVFTPHNFEGMD